MESFDEWQQLWHSAGAQPKPDVARLIATLKGHRRRLLAKGLFAVLCMAGTLMVLVWVMCSYRSQLWTTRLGEVLMVVCVLGAVVMRSRLLKGLWHDVDDALDIQSYLARLEKFKERQVFMHTAGISVYFILLSAGLAFYLFEFAYYDLVFGLVAYALTFGWMLFGWFYLRPRTIRKQTSKLNDMIATLQGYVRQLDDVPGNQKGA